MRHRGGGVSFGSVVSGVGRDEGDCGRARPVRRGSLSGSSLLLPFGFHVSRQI